MSRKAAVLARTEVLPPMAVPDEVRDGVHDFDEPPEVVDEVAEDGLDADATITDNVGEQSIEINVESLIAELEADSGHGSSREVQCSRRKLEDYLERKRIAQELEDFEDFVVED
ncbi:MAG: hypothetical protein ABI567_06295 [Gammaproteobacteria bacterium]